MTYVRYLRYLIPFVLVLYAAWQGLFASGVFAADSKLTERTPALGVLLPAGRVERGPDGVVLMHEPVYADVTLPLRSRRVTFEITTTAGSAPIRVGVRQGPGWDYVFPEAEVSEQGGYRTYQITVSDWQHLEPGYALRFLVSAPRLAPGGVVFEGARVRVEREPFSFTWLQERFRNVL